MISIVKLNNNVEIIGRVVQETSNFVVVDNPFTINYMFSPRSEKPVIGLLRYLPFAESRRIKFDNINILNIETARNSMSGYYESVLKTHVEEIDKSIDNELESISDMKEETETAADMLSALLERMNPNNKMH